MPELGKAQGGPVPRQEMPKRRPASKYADEYEAEASKPLRAVLLGVLAVPLAIVGFVLFVSLQTGHRMQAYKLEEGMMANLLYGVDRLAENKRAVRDQHLNLTQLSGASFWYAAGRLNAEDLPSSMLVSLRSSNDVPVSEKDLKDPQFKPPASACSYTAPRGEVLFRLLEHPEETILFTFNSRNWQNYPDQGVIVVWADRTVGWLTQEDASDRWGITQEEWNDPAGKLFGKKAPFQHTYE